MKTLDPHARVPLYRQLFVILREAIFRGEFAPNSLLPSESELESLFGVSRITVRRALNELSDRSLVQREKGRGTRVSQRSSPPPELVDSIETMISNNLTMGVETTVRLLAFDYVPAPKDVAQALFVTRGCTVQYSVRVRERAQEPISHLQAYVPAAIGRNYAREDISTLPLLALIESAGVIIGHARQTISAESASAEVACALRVEVGSPLLRIDRTVYQQDNRPVEYLIARYAPHLYKYHMILERKGHGGRPIGWKIVS